MNIITVNDIHTVLSGKEIHKGISFAIPKGQITALIGGSGSGKTVLLREMLCLLTPTSGTIKILDTCINTSSEDIIFKVMKKIGVLFQMGALFSGMTVYDNVASPLREHSNLSESSIEEIVHLKLLLSGLSVKDGDKLPAELSGGMVKRAALARALALEPTLLFLDEPTSGLDPINARAFDELIKTLSDSLGISVFMVTHDLDTLTTIPDSIIVLANGSVVAHDSYDVVKSVDHPWIKEYFQTRK